MIKYTRSKRLIILTSIALLVIISIIFLIKQSKKKSIFTETNGLPELQQDTMIAYGKELIINTSKYLGPHGAVAKITNGLNCGNCHLQGGTKLFSNNFLGVASSYPKYRDRSGRLESIEFRINDCLQRSLNGKSIDSLSREMRAMVAYIKWTGKNVNIKTTEGVKTKEVPFMNVAADSTKGAIIYQAKCKVCHGQNGEGTILKDSVRYTYPPLWGSNSYAASAGMYRITKLVSFIKYNMPNGAAFNKPQLTDEEAWNLAAYINSKPHPQKLFANDWPKLATKPVDYPFGPYADTFSERQHKYGPFTAMAKEIKK